MLAGKTAIVTGASSGIGASLCRVLAQEHDVRVIAAARRRERLRALVDEIEHDAELRALDLGTSAGCEELLASTVGAGRAVDILINNAGMGTYDEFLRTPWERLQAQLRLNIESLTHLCRLFAPAMVERGRGHIVNVASMAAYLPTPLFAVYGATKAYVRNFTETLDHELRETGVRALSINPGGVRTEFMSQAGQDVANIDSWVYMDSDRCARIIVDAMKAGRRNVVPGMSNAFGAWLLRFVPRRLLPTIAARALASAVDRKT